MPLSLSLQGPTFSNAEIYFFAVHVIFMTIALMGGILLMTWMIKNLKPRQLFTWLVIFIIVGLAGSFLTFRQEMDFMTKFLWGGTITNTSSNPLQK